MYEELFFEKSSKIVVSWIFFSEFTRFSHGLTKFLRRFEFSSSEKI